MKFFRVMIELYELGVDDIQGCFGIKFYDLHCIEAYVLQYLPFY